MPRIELETDVPIVLRDGTVTRADVWRPVTDRPVSAVLVRTPYDRRRLDHQSPVDPRRAAERGFALVLQDVRGRYGSAGTFTPFLQERADGYDSVQAVAELPWCDGNVGMTGWSYVGATAWLAAESAPPALRAIAPLNSTNRIRSGWMFRGEASEAGFVTSWVAASLGLPDTTMADRLDDALARPEDLRRLVPRVSTWLGTEQDDDYWAELAPRDVAVPVLHVGGWYDIFVDSTVEGHRGRSRPDDRLLIGPWAHDNLFGHLVGDRNLGSAGSGDAVGLGERVLDFLAAASEGRPCPQPPVTVYQLGAGWRALESWPPPGAAEVVLDIPPGDLVVDGADPPPSLGGRGLLVGVTGGGWGPHDQAPIAGRPDVLTRVLPGSRGLVLSGPVTARLPVRADGPGDSREWTVLLCSADDDGRLDVLTEGVSVAPTAARLVTVALGPVCAALRDDQQLAVLVSGGSTPRWRPVAGSGRRSIDPGAALAVTAEPA
jgi:predicted acyl esterase